MQEELHLDVVNESRFSFLFFEKIKKLADKKSICRCCEETRLVIFSVLLNKSQCVFRQSDREETRFAV